MSILFLAIIISLLLFLLQSLIVIRFIRNAIVNIILLISLLLQDLWTTAQHLYTSLITSVTARYLQNYILKKVITAKYNFCEMAPDLYKTVYSGASQAIWSIWDLQNRVRSRILPAPNQPQTTSSPPSDSSTPSDSFSMVRYMGYTDRGQCEREKKVDGGIWYCFQHKGQDTRAHVDRIWGTRLLQIRRKESGRWNWTRYSGTYGRNLRIRLLQMKRQDTRAHMDGIWGLDYFRWNACIEKWYISHKYLPLRAFYLNFYLRRAHSCKVRMGWRMDWCFARRRVCAFSTSILPPFTRGRFLESTIGRGGEVRHRSVAWAEKTTDGFRWRRGPSMGREMHKPQPDQEERWHALDGYGRSRAGAGRNRKEWR